MRQIIIFEILAMEHCEMIWIEKMETVRTYRDPARTERIGNQQGIVYRILFGQLRT